MSVDYTAPSFSGGTPSGIALTNAFADIEEVLKDVVSRTGTIPNAMESDLDLNGNDLLNVGGIGSSLLTEEDIEGLRSTVGTLDSRLGFNEALIRRNEEELDALGLRVSSLQDVDIVDNLDDRLSSLETATTIQSSGLQNANIRISETINSLSFVNPKIDGVQRFLGEVDPATQTFPTANKGDVVIMTGNGQLSTRVVQTGQAWRAQVTTAAGIGNNWVRHPSDDIIESSGSMPEFQEGTFSEAQQWTGRGIFTVKGESTTELNGDYLSDSSGLRKLSAPVETSTRYTNTQIDEIENLTTADIPGANWVDFVGQEGIEIPTTWRVISLGSESYLELIA